MSAAANTAAGMLTQVGIPTIWLLRQVLKVILVSIGVTAGGMGLLLIVLNGSLAELSTHLRDRLATRSERVFVNPDTDPHLVTT